MLQGCTWCISVAGRGVCGAFEAHVYQFSAKSQQQQKFHFQNWQVLTIVPCLVIFFLFLIKIKQICGDLLFVSFQLYVCVREGERVCVFSVAIKQQQQKWRKKK